MKCANEMLRNCKIQCNYYIRHSESFACCITEFISTKIWLQSTNLWTAHAFEYLATL